MLLTQILVNFFVKSSIKLTLRTNLANLSLVLCKIFKWKKNKQTLRMEYEHIWYWASSLSNCCMVYFLNSSSPSAKAYPSLLGKTSIGTHYLVNWVYSFYRVTISTVHESVHCRQLFIQEEVSLLKLASMLWASAICFCLIVHFSEICHRRNIEHLDCFWNCARQPQLFRISSQKRRSFLY